MDDQKQFVLVLDRNYDGEGYSLGVFDKDTYVMTDGDCLEREGDTLDGYTAEFLTDYQLEQKLQTLRAVLQDILAAGAIKEDEYPLLMARAKAALDGGGA